LANLSFAQRDTLLIESIPELEIKALRINTPSSDAPMMVHTPYRSYNGPANILAVRSFSQMLSVQEYLQSSPGLFTLNANNYAQDLRISIRGFGARASFGIRGIKLLVDGIPETSPDGQGQLDNTDPMNIQNIEIINGPVSSLYGNASGGVLSINTVPRMLTPFIESRINLGSFNFQQYQLKTGLRFDKSSIFLSLNQTSTDGYRDQSEFQTSNLNAHIIHQEEKLKYHFILNYTDSPIANDPGSINLEDLLDDRTQARQQNIDFKTGEAIDQFKIAFKMDAKLNPAEEIKAYAFITTRNFEGILPFEFGGIVDLNRTYYGSGIAFKKKKSLPKGINQLQIGTEVNIQNDERNRFRNLLGTQGDQTLGQDEMFQNYAVYAIDHFKFRKLFIQFGIRFDINRIQNKDDFLSNGDDSGNINWNSLNPNIGLSYRLNNETMVYSNFRTAFETPSLSELSNNPLGQGFNLNLNPQKSTNYEVGLKYKKRFKFHFDVALFYINTIKEFVPFELEDMPGQTFFRNAGSSQRTGIEISTMSQLGHGWRLQTAYTYSDFKYKHYSLDNESFDGNQLPGIPKSYAYIGLIKTQGKGLNMLLDTKFIGPLFTSDNNEIQDSGYILTNLQASYIMHLKKFTCSPFFGIKNLADSKYNDNIRINASGNRFYEAGPGINFYGGFNLKYSIYKK